ncbi:hypothetical protein [Holdemanella porci]|uniref:hypothetical protein n=1 Tax=Holdemanella porci TaxID=2652276 RepID=UPI0029423AFD|nr:hypothetical protein [Holdemanella porci]
MTLDEAIIHAKELAENQSICKDCREEHKQLAAWSEELKQYKEEKIQETNLDHFQQEILEKGLWNLAVVKGGPKRCDRTKCIDCELRKDRSRGCHEKVMDWLKQPYIKSAYKLTKFEKDLLQSYSNIYKYKFKAIPVLIRMKEKGYFKDINEDATVKGILADCEITEED